jgi:hypothetical protein
MFTVPVTVNSKSIYLFVVVLKVTGGVLIIPSNIYGPATPTVTVLLF